jgi:hypothetical protein
MHTVQRRVIRQCIVLRLRRLPFLLLFFACASAFASDPVTPLPAADPAMSAIHILEPRPETLDLLQLTGADPDFSLVSPGSVGLRPNSSQPEPGLKPELIAAPIPFFNPGLGAGLSLAGGYIFPVDPSDRISPPSIVGVGGFYSASGSWALGGGVKLNLEEDRYRLTLGGAHASINTSFYGIGNTAGQSGKSIELKQEFTGGVVEVLRQTIPHLFIGGRYLGINMKTSIQQNSWTYDLRRYEK